MHAPFVRAVVGAGFFCAVSMTAFASGAVQVNAAQAPSVSAIRAAGAALAKLSSHGSNELFANPDRAYPPSCLQAPLSLGLYANDPNRVQSTITLSGDAYNAQDVNYLESDTVTLFRVPCAGGVSALLMEIDRPSSVDGNTTNYPVFPLNYVYVDSTDVVPLRTPQDPNTFLDNTIAGVPLYVSSVFVIENYYDVGLDLDYNQAISVYVDNLLSDSNADTQRFDVPAYNPADYTAASQPLPITGYQSGNYYDSTRGGEGIQVEVGETSTSGTYVMTIAWYTFDSTGTPYWLYGSGYFTTGSEGPVAVPLYYGANGGFAGNFTSVAFAPWGTINVTFPDCNTMDFTYASNAGLPTSVPAGSGSKIWTRLTQLNGLTCQ